MELIKFIFSSFWVFFGALIFATLILNFILKMWNCFFRHWNIRKHGYPPNCDADGDFKIEKEDKE